MKSKSHDLTVSICSITFNHAPYIRQCLDGFLMQKCNFKFEILIHDDSSTDGTQEIIREYVEKYPEIIKPIFQTENQWSQGIRNIQSRYNFPRAKGKYIALCEGDDYWTDPLKLQKQVDFLEENEDYVMCFHNSKTQYNVKGFNKDFPVLENREYSSNEIFSQWIVPTASIVFNYKVINDLNSKISNKKILNGDLILILTCLDNGKIFGFYDSMSVYRVHEGGVTISNLKDNKLLTYKHSYLLHYKFIKETFPQVDRNLLNIKFYNMHRELSKIYINKKNILKFIDHRIRSYYYSPKSIIRDIIKWI